MKIKSVKKVILNEPKQFYDVIEANPCNNFLIKTDSGYVVSHNCNFTDEVNFSLVSNPEKQKQKMLKLITQIDARMKSRFLRGTYLPTLNILASSKDTEQSFLEAYIENKQKNESKNTLIVDEPQWVVDSRKDSPIKFYVAIGNKFLANELLPLNVTETQLDDFRAKGYELWQVPIGYLDTFQQNLDEAICSIIGIATASSLKYISGVKLNETKTETYKNPFTKDVIEVGNAPTDHLQYANFFDLSAVSEEDKARPLFIHLDMSISGDKTGIAGVWITGKSANINHNNLLTAGNTETALTQIDTETSMDMAYKLAFSVSIKAPKGAQVSFAKNRNFIRWLTSQGFAVKGISMDTFQSAAVLQDLISDGYKAEILTVDRVAKDANGKPLCLPYHYLKSAIYERRIQIYKKCDLLTDELVGLERKADGHIDHTKQGINCLVGDTKISLVDGREVAIKDLVDEYNLGKKNYVYTINETTLKIEPKLIKKAFKSGTAAKLLKITLDNGQIIKCTPEHRFMLRNGTYCEASNLQVADSLMPLYRKYPDEKSPMHDYRLYYEPIEDAWHYEHRKFAQEVLDKKYLVHHKNCIKIDNSPTNLVWCSRELHMLIHALLETGAQSPEAKAKRSESLKKWHQANKNSIDYILSHNKSLTIDDIDKYLAKKEAELLRIEALNAYFNINYATLTGSEKQYYVNLYSNIQKGYKIGSTQEAAERHKVIRQQIIDLFHVDYDQLSPEERQSYAIKLARQTDPTYQERVTTAVKANHKDGKYENAYKALQQNNETIKQLKILYPIVDKDRFIELFGFDYYEIDTSTKAGASKKGVWSNRYRKAMYELLNHSITQIEELYINEDVYDLTIADNHNFALSCGIFVHNSKDQADAVCGATYLASKYSTEYSYSYGDNLAAALNANDDDPEADKKAKFIADFQNELTKIYFDIAEANNKEQQNQMEEYQYYQNISNGIIII